MAMTLFAIEHLQLCSYIFRAGQEGVPLLLRWLAEVERGYNANPYHNSAHAADVVHSTLWLLCSVDGLLEAVGSLTLVVLIISACVHDLGHVGTSNSFQVETGSELALVYNDRAVQEQYHVSFAFQLLSKPQLNFLYSWKKEKLQEFRKLVIEAVLATDMTQHFAMLSSIRALATADANSKVLVKKCHNKTLISTIIKLADLGHAWKPLPLHLKWCSLITQEFYEQGDKEKALGLPVSVLNDREKDDLAASQCGFLAYVVSPLVEATDALLPLPAELIRNKDCTSLHWRCASGLLPATSSANSPRRSRRSSPVPTNSQTNSPRTPLSPPQSVRKRLSVDSEHPASVSSPSSPKQKATSPMSRPRTPASRAPALTLLGGSQLLGSPMLPTPPGNPSPRNLVGNTPSPRNTSSPRATPACSPLLASTASPRASGTSFRVVIPPVSTVACVVETTSPSSSSPMASPSSASTPLSQSQTSSSPKNVNVFQRGLTLMSNDSALFPTTVEED